MDSIKPIYKLLGRKNSELADLITRAKLLKKQNFLLKSTLPEAFATHCHFVPHTASSMTLLIDSPLLATRLQYEEREILRKIKLLDGYQGIEQLTIKVDPTPAYSPPEKKGAINIPIPESETGSRLLASLSNSVDDAELGEALQRLSLNLQKSR